MSEEDRIKKLEEEVEELKRQNRILANALLNHLKGNLTVQDIELCYQALVRIKKALSIVPSTGGVGSIESIIAQHLLEAREKQKQKEETQFEDIPLDELEKIRKEVKKENEGKSSKNG